MGVFFYQPLAHTSADVLALGSSKWFLAAVTVWLLTITECSLLQMGGFVLYAVGGPLIALVRVAAIVADKLRPAGVVRQFLIEATWSTPKRGLSQKRGRHISAGPMRGLWIVMLTAAGLGWDGDSSLLIFIAVATSGPLLLRSAFHCFAVAARPPPNVVSRIAFVYATIAVAADHIGRSMVATEESHTDRGTALRRELLAWTVRWWLLAAISRIMTYGYLLARTARSELATAMTLASHSRRALALLTSALVASAMLLRLSVGPDRMAQPQAFLLALNLLGPGAVSTSHPLPSPLLTGALSLFGWFLFGLWLSPLAQLFLEWRNHRAKEIATWAPVLRKVVWMLVRSRNHAENGRTLVQRRHSS